MSAKYRMPSFLVGVCTEGAYIRWLSRKAIAHVRRDRARGNYAATRAEYMEAIHAAVVISQGYDYYTGEELAWSLISQYRNDESKQRKRDYKREFALLPTIDHVGDGRGPADFRICSWRTNDCKNDLSNDELLMFCRAVIAYSERSSPP